MITAKNLQYECVGHILFKNVSLNLQPGEILQIAGPNGCGKTSLLRILCGLVRPQQGHVVWADEKITQEASNYQQSLTYLGHESGLKANLTAIENLHLLAAISGKSSQQDAESSLQQVGLANRRSVLCRHLSAGQRKRVGLARLVMLKANLWILDEPFSALDEVGVELLITLLNVHRKQGGIAIFTSHQRVALADTKLLSLETC